MNTITTHVLDTVRGRPASHLEVTLERRSDDGQWEFVASSRTDENGRVTRWPGTPAVSAGDFRLTFATAGHASPAFYPEVTVVFTVRDPAEHYHVPLLISPYGYTTYRGS